MTNILFIGNSHIGSLKYGVSELSRQSEYNERLSCLDFSFCGSAGAVGMNLIGHHVVVDPTSRGYQEFVLTTGGETSVDLDNFDVICLVGRLTTLDIRCFANSAFSPLSESNVFNIVANLVNANFNANLIYGQIIEQYPDKCYWMPNPCEPYIVNSLFKDNPSRVPANFQKIRETNSDATFLPFLESSSESIAHLLLNLSEEIRCQTCLYASKLGLAGVIFPNESLLIDGFRTRSEYSIGSRHFAVSDHLEEDIDPHMNSYYGEAMLRLFLDHL